MKTAQQTMKNIHVIPTDKPSRLLKSVMGYNLHQIPFSDVNKIGCNRHIYITSDEEIKEGDWCYGLFSQKPFILIDFEIVKNNFPEYKSEYKKIILTTDQDLIKNGVQAIDDEFLNWFVKNPSCEEVEVKDLYPSICCIQKEGKTKMNNGCMERNRCLNYKIIIPSEEPKYPIRGYAPGNYMCYCSTCKIEFQGDKRAVQCEPCAVSMTKEEPNKTHYLDELPNIDKDTLAKMWEAAIPKIDSKRKVFLMNAHETIDTRVPKQEIVGYRLKPSIDRRMIDAILKNSMPIWNDEDKSVYFIRGHVAGSLVARMKELQVLDLWFTPIYEFEEVKSDWIKQNHLDYYYKEGIMSNKPKQETVKIDLTNLCYYDKRNPDCSLDDEDIEGHKKSLLKKNKTCSCDNCFYGRSKLTEQLILQAERMYSEEDLRNAYRWGTTVNHGTKEHFEEWFEQLKKK